MTELNKITTLELFEEIGKRIVSKEIDNNYKGEGESCVDENGNKKEIGCECEGTTGLFYRNKQDGFVYILDLETGNTLKAEEE